MAEEIRQELRSVPYSRGRRQLLEMLATRRAMWALVVAVAILALLIAILYTRVLSILPGYPAVLIAFLVWAVAPGLLLQRALFGSRAVSLFERLAVAFLLSMALASVPGLLALRLHWSLQTFATLYAVVAAAVSGLSLLWHREEEDAATVREPGSAFPAGPLMLIVGVSLLAILTSPIWAGDRITRDSDAWVYMAYVNNYRSADDLDPTAPSLGMGAYQRMFVNVWAVVQALVADVSGVEPHDVLMLYLPPLLTLLALAATYTLAKGLFRNTTVALLAVIFQLGYAFLDLSPHEGFGRNVLFRIGEDKMVASFVLFPIGLLLISRFLSMPTPRSYVASQLAVLALFVVHPMAVLFLGMALVFLAALRAGVERSLRPLRAGGVFLLPLAVLAALLFAYLLPHGWQVPRLSDPRLFFRQDFHIVTITDDLSMGNYHLILHPLMLAALLLAPIVWWRSRHETGNQVILATTLGVLVLFFTPIFATPLGKLVSWQAVWRLPWILPVSLILACASYEGLQALSRRRGAVSFLGGFFAAPAVRWATPAVMAGLVLGGAFLVQEQYLRLDGGAFYDWTSSTSILPYTNGSILLGGVDRGFSGAGRLRPDDEQLLDYVEARFPKGSVVLVDPWWLNQVIPGVLTDIHPVAFVGAPGASGPRRDAEAFAHGTLSGPELEAVVDRYGVDYIIARETGPANASVRALSSAEWVVEISPYEVYIVQR